MSPSPSRLAKDTTSVGVEQIASDSNSGSNHYPHLRSLRRANADRNKSHYRDPLAESKQICIGIAGGVGPAAGVMLHQKIIEATISGGSDQGHCEVHHVSRPGVADRTSFLLGQSKENPASGMALTIEAIAESARKAGKTAVVAGVPCNTFHAPPIWNEFIETLDANGTSTTVKMVHMLHETARAIETIVPNAKKIGLLSTTGTRDSKVYANLLEPMGYEMVQVDPLLQPMVHDAIYNKAWGVKAVQPTTYQACGAFANFARDLVVQGAEAIILGCTEIPLALPEPHFSGLPLIDPMAVLARSCIKKAGALATELEKPDVTKVLVASSAPTSVLVREPEKDVVVHSGHVSTRKHTTPVWHQHAAAFVIQSHFRAFLSIRRKASCDMLGISPSLSREEFFRTCFCGSPTTQEQHGITPEVFTPTSEIAAAVCVFFPPRK